MKSLYVVPLLLFLTACPTRNNPDFTEDDGGAGQCRTDQECTAPDAPICGDGGQCRGCETSPECVARDDAFPTCMGGMCVATCIEGDAGDAQCAASDPARPYCVGETCVECRGNDDCDGKICDQAAGACTPCTEHAQCDSGACDRDNGGTCVADTDIIYVDKADAMADDAGECTSATPCQSIGGAITRIEMALDARNLIVVRGGAYGELLAINGITVTIIGSGATLQPGVGQTGEPVIKVSNGAGLALEDITVTLGTGGANGDGIQCNGVAGTEPILRLHHISVADNSGTGVEATNCAVRITRSTLSTNTLGGVRLNNSSFHITNNFIVNNGNIATNPVGGVAIDNFGASDQAERIFVFNTVAGNQANNTADSRGVRCRSDNATVAMGNIVHGNLGEKPSISGTCTWMYSDIEGGPTGNGNIDVPPQFMDENGNDFHLQGDNTGIVDVDGLSSDILVDYDDDSRPQNGLFDMGADEVAVQ